VLELIADAKAKGYNFVLGGEVSPGPGYFVPISIIDNPPEDSRIVQEEQFGPVLPLMKFDDIDDVIARTNATDYGLGASIWSADEDKALALSSRIASGTVWINEAGYLSPLGAFGGMKQSGLGSEGALEGLLEYTNAQTVYVKKKVAAPAAE
jgi:aldehyde dehydrogenase (NAD+)